MQWCKAGVVAMVCELIREVVLKKRNHLEIRIILVDPRRNSDVVSKTVFKVHKRCTRRDSMDVVLVTLKQTLNKYFPRVIR